MQVMRLYNISQETKLDPGGLEHCSYMYSLGSDAREQGWWVDEVKAAAESLFEPVAGKVTEVVEQLKRR
eukprot:scaffold3720_cov401-Prasinococcus_capsulatus_cf.AAC.1